MNVFAKILHGIEWLGKEVGKGLKDIPKFLRLTQDAEKVAQDALPQAIAVIQDAGELSAASIKDSGVFLAAFGNLTGAISKAISEKGMNVADDGAVLTAFKAFVKDFNVANVRDIVAAYDKLVADTRSLDATVILGLEKMKQDAK